MHPISCVDHSERIFEGEKLKIVYAGLLGIAQGINKLCEELNYNNIEFHIYGAGAEKEKIQSFIYTIHTKPRFKANCFAIFYPLLSKFSTTISCSSYYGRI